MTIFFAASDALSWEHFAQTWGPAVPMFVIFCYYIHRLVFAVVPRGFRSIRQVIQDEGKIAGQRHDEALEMIQAGFDDMHIHRRRRRRPKKKLPV